MFRKREINPFPVSDKVTFRNVDKEITLYVRANASALVLGLKNVNERLNAFADSANEDEHKAVARAFADTLFGAEQGEKLYDFYGEPLAVITACGMYFKDRLAKKITKAQKK